LIFAKVLVITLVVIAFLALVILWWQANDGGAYNAGYEAGQHGAFIEMGGGANSTQWFQGFQDGAQERKRSQ